MKPLKNLEHFQNSKVLEYQSGETYSHEFKFTLTLSFFSLNRIIILKIKRKSNNDNQKS